MIMLILLFIGDTNFNNMNVLSWSGLIVSAMWVLVFVFKLYVIMKGDSNEPNER
ncbi:hypothetical protein [Oceanobacillus sp. 1P07AA]|uniref:hypothetical protein n=1 Tax=Oceanobacillus sp. 1P07AA TaxID=3132293 RepID=UPI0039A50051